MPNEELADDEFDQLKWRGDKFSYLKIIREKNEIIRKLHETNRHLMKFFEREDENTEENLNNAHHYHHLKALAREKYDKNGGNWGYAYLNEDGDYISGTDKSWTDIRDFIPHNAIWCICGTPKHEIEYDYSWID